MASPRRERQIEEEVFGPKAEDKSKIPLPPVTEVSTPSSRLKSSSEEEQHGPEESLTSAEASASGSALGPSGAAGATRASGPSLSSLTSDEPASAPGSTSHGGSWASGSGGGGNDVLEPAEKEHLFDKVVTPSDVGKLNRLVIPKQHAEKYFPLDASSANEKGLLLTFEDRDGKVWRFRYSYWNSSQSYVMTKGWSRFVKEKRLDAGDIISFSRGVGGAARDRLFIDWRRRLPRSAPRAAPPASQGGRRVAASVRPLEHAAPPATLNEHHRQLRFFGSAGVPPRGHMPTPTPTPMMHITVQPSSAVTGSLPMDLDSVPPIKRPTAAAKRVRLFGLDLDNPQRNRQRTGGEGSYAGSSSAVGKQRADTHDIGGEVGPVWHGASSEMQIEDFAPPILPSSKSQHHDNVESSQFPCMGPGGIFKRCLNVVQFVVRIKARGRLHQARKTYTTHGSSTTEEFGGTADRLLAKRHFLRRKARTKDLDGKFRMSAFTEVEKPYLTFHRDVKEWIAIRKQYEGGLHHTCMQQGVDNLLGRSDTRQMIMEKILLDRYGGSNHTVICINAESGHGKTSLLRVLYNDQQLVDAFDKRIWIQMTDKLDILMMYRKIIEFFMSDHCSITDINFLQEMVMEEIADKKLLLFLDDADIEDQQFWTSISKVLYASGKGSAVVMSKKSSTYAPLTGFATHSYFLNPLSKENNLMILQQYSCVGIDIQSNPDLLMVAQRFISRFGYNPLNLKAIAALLCHADSISVEMEKFEAIVTPLQLCHDVLLIHLKKCLAFCSLFPEGYIFDKHHMVLQWISHGCVRPVEGRKLEDVGAEYFNELLCRSFFQYSPVHNDTDGKFAMHELVYKVIGSVSRDKYFKSEGSMSSVPENILHLSLVSSQFETVELVSKTEELKDLQTFLVVQPEGQPYNISFPKLNLVGLDDFFLKFTSLEMLDLSHTDTGELPGSIVGLRNLQYLSVSNTNIRALPSELCNLSNLQTLEAKDCRFLTELPGDTKKLLKLRHLDLTKELGYVQLPQGIGQLTELQTLPDFHASSDPSHCSVSELGNLHNLRGCLRVSGLESVKTGSKAQEANLKDKHHLKDLTLQWHDGGINADNEDEDEDAENVADQVLQSLQPHTNLQELAIRGYEGSAFPAWMQSSSSLPNLVSLTLDSCCNCTKFPAIAQLPSLKFLSVRKMYDVQLLSSDTHCGAKFPSLELLNLWEMYGLEELFEASEGDCPRLRKVCISRCPELKMLPCTPSVTELVLHCGRQLPDIPDLVSLVSLKIEGFHGVKSFSLPAAEALPVLKKVEIKSCKELLSVDGLSALTTIQRLKIEGCPKLVLPRTDSLTT